MSQKIGIVVRRRFHDNIAVTWNAVADKYLHCVEEKKLSTERQDQPFETTMAAETVPYHHADAR